MKLYYIIDIMNYKVVGIHRNEVAADKAVESHPQLEIHAVEPGDLYIVYSYSEPNTEEFPDVKSFEQLPTDYCLIALKDPEYEAIAKQRLNITLNEIIKCYQIITMEETENFANAVVNARDAYLKASVKPDLKDQPFTHYSIRSVGKGFSRVVYHIVIDLTSY